MIGWDWVVLVISNTIFLDTKEACDIIHKIYRQQPEFGCERILEDLGAKYEIWRSRV